MRDIDGMDTQQAGDLADGALAVGEQVHLSLAPVIQLLDSIRMDFCQEATEAGGFGDVFLVGCRRDNRVIILHGWLLLFLLYFLDGWMQDYYRQSYHAIQGYMYSCGYGPLACCCLSLCYRFVLHLSFFIPEGFLLANPVEGRYN